MLLNWIQSNQMHHMIVIQKDNKNCIDINDNAKINRTNSINNINSIYTNILYYIHISNWVK